MSSELRTPHPMWAEARRVQVRVAVTVDWTGPGHYDAAQKAPCRFCNLPTHERDESGTACDKACLESVLAQELLGQANTWIRDERVPAPAAARRRSVGSRLVTRRPVLAGA